MHMLDTEQPSNPSLYELAPGVWVQADDLRFRFSRSGGPGGQNVNKVNTKAELCVRPEALRGLTPEVRARLDGLLAGRMSSEGDYQIVSGAWRTQEGNRRACLEKLGRLVALALLAPIPRRATKPTRRSRLRRMEAKLRRSEKKGARARGFRRDTD